MHERVRGRDTSAIAVARASARQRAWDWVVDHDELFVLAPYEQPSEQAFIKRTGELAAIAAVLVDANHTNARELLDRSWARLGHGDRLATLAIHPAVATVYVPFWRHGLRHRELERVLVANAKTIEQPQVRLLVAGALGACELAAPWDLDELLAESWLGAFPATWSITEQDAYVVTHLIFYLAPAGLLPARYRTFLRRAIAVWIGLFARAGDMDLVAELIMAAHVLGDCVDVMEWKFLLDAQEPDGLVPFRRAWRGLRAPPALRFQANYHSTLVALAACAMCSHDNDGTVDCGTEEQARAGRDFVADGIGFVPLVGTVTGYGSVMYDIISSEDTGGSLRGPVDRTGRAVGASNDGARATSCEETARPRSGR
jgi:hypothetical protein